MTAPNPASRPPMLPLVLLGLLSATTLGGPLSIFILLRGGAHPEWPPDRLVEWVAFVVTLVLGLTLTAACIATALRSRSRPQ